MYLSIHFNYSILTAEKKLEGYGFGSILLDQNAYFAKKIFLQGGQLEWDPVFISELKATFLWSSEKFVPGVNFDHVSTIEMMINDHQGDKKVKTLIM